MEDYVWLCLFVVCLLSTLGRTQVVADEPTFPTKFKNRVELKRLSTGSLVLEYSIDRASEFDENNAYDDGEIMWSRLTLTHDKNTGAWLGLGFNIEENSQMVGSRAVLGLPFEGEPLLWDLGGKDTTSVTTVSDAVILYPNDDGEAAFRQNDTHSVLEFGLASREIEAGHPFFPNTVIWAIGSGNILGHHAYRGAFILLDESSEDQPIQVVSLDPPFKTLWKMHGWFAFLAWGVLTPLGISAPILRNLFSGPSWLVYHIAFQVSTVILTIVTIIFSISLTAASHEGHFDGNHKRFGLLLLFGAIFQLFVGGFRPSKMDESTTLHRILWEIFHRAIGLFLFLMAVFQILSGIERFHLKYAEGESFRNVYWIYLAVFIFVVLFIRVLIACRGSTKVMDTAEDQHELARMGSPPYDDNKELNPPSQSDATDETTGLGQNTTHELT